MNWKRILTHPFAIFLYVVVVAVILFTLFGWGAPLSVNDQDDVTAVETLLNTDSTSVSIVRMSEVETLDGQDVQSVFYTVNDDSLQAEKVAIVDVQKGFLKYKAVKLHEK